MANSFIQAFHALLANLPRSFALKGHKYGGQERLRFLNSLRQSLLDLSRRLGQGASADAVDYVMFRLRQITRHLLHLGGVENLTEEVHNSLVTVMSMLSRVEQQQDLTNVLTTERNGRAGRPQFEISKEQLEYFFCYDFSL